MRAGSEAWALAAAAGLGALLLVAALARGEPFLGAALWLAGATYVGSLAAAGGRVDAAAPLAAAGLLICGELTAWSLDERSRLRADPTLSSRRTAGIAVLGLAGLAAATLVVGLSAVPPSHGIAWTVAGAAASVIAAGAGVWATRG